jgi:uncharacterized membrane protein
MRKDIDTVLRMNFQMPTLKVACLFKWRRAGMSRSLATVSLACALAVMTGAMMTGACASSMTPAQLSQLRLQLRDAMQVRVETRAQRDDQSRLLANIVAQDAVDGLDRPQVSAAFGPGKACDLEVCRKNGFTRDDWYYEIGVMADPHVKQLPLLLFAFNMHDQVTKVFTLTTH